MHFKDVSLLIEQGLEDAKAALAASTLPDKADIGFINDLLLELHGVNK